MLMEPASLVSTKQYRYSSRIDRMEKIQMKFTTMFAAIVLLTLFTAGVAVFMHGAPSDRATLSGSVPAWANSANFKGAANPSDGVGFRIYLGWNDSSATEALARAVSDPKSPSYGKYLTPQEFRRQFAPSQSQVNALQSWLRSQGFTVVNTPANNHYVAAEGTIAQAEAAFTTRFGLYDVKGKTVRSPSTNISIPTSLSSIVTGVIGLDDSAVFLHTHRVKDDAAASAGFRNAPPFSTYWAQSSSPYSVPAGYTQLGPIAPWTVQGYTPAQIKAAYGISGYDGAGQTVAVIEAYASPTILQDVNEWSTRRDLPTMNPSQLIQVVPPGVYRRPQNPRQDPEGWYGEETLDIEAVHGMAPAARIVFVASPNQYQDMDAALNHVVDQRLAQIVTNSYGFATELVPFGYVKPIEDTLIQAAIEGIGVYFYSGDNGDESSQFGFATTEWPTSSPWVTAVGGTSLGISQSNERVLETGWGASTYDCDTASLVCTRVEWLYGSGGGVSMRVPEPFYQTDAKLRLSGRGVPDVAAIGDPQTGMIVGQTQTFPDGVYYDEYRVAGTSLSSPLFAGLMALADQSAGHAHGFANPLFYANPNAFYDVQSVKTAVARRDFVNDVDGSEGTKDLLRTFDDYSGSISQHTGTGWDNVTGLGSPSNNFLAAFGH